MKTNKALPKYAKYLLEAGILEQLVDLNMNLAHQYNLFVMKYHKDIDLRQMTKQSHEKFLLDASEGKALENAIDMLERWGKNELSISPSKYQNQI